MMVRRLMTLAVGSAAVFLGSCVTNSGSIYISGVLGFDLAMCTVDVAGTPIIRTTYDVAVGGPVVVNFRVENLIQQRNFNVETDVSTVIVNEAEISLADASGAAAPGSAGAFIVDVAGGIVPGSVDGISPGQGAVSVQLIPPVVIAAAAGITMPTTIVATVTLRGRTNGHIKVEGGPYTWVVTLFPAFSSESSSCADPVGCCSAGQNGEGYCLNAAGTTIVGCNHQ